MSCGYGWVTLLAELAEAAKLGSPNDHNRCMHPEAIG